MSPLWSDETINIPLLTSHIFTYLNSHNSNTPGMKVTMGDYDVPFEKHVNVGELLSKMHVKTDKKLIDNDEDENNVDYLEDNSVKKRKRKRGKAV